MRRGETLHRPASYRPRAADGAAPSNGRRLLHHKNRCAAAICDFIERRRRAVAPRIILFMPRQRGNHRVRGASPANRHRASSRRADASCLRLGSPPAHAIQPIGRRLASSALNIGLTLAHRRNLRSAKFLLRSASDRRRQIKPLNRGSPRASLSRHAASVFILDSYGISGIRRPADAPAEAHLRRALMQPPARARHNRRPPAAP